MKGFVIIVGAVLATSATCMECPENFFVARSGCFSVFEQPSPGPTDLEWSTARELCQGLYHPGWSFDLATFDDTAQLEAVTVAWSKIKDGSHPYMWVGIHGHEGVWQYIDGRPISINSNIWRESYPRDLNQKVYLDDVSLHSEEPSFGRLYASSTSTATVRLYMCRASIF